MAKYAILTLMALALAAPGLAYAQNTGEIQDSDGSAALDIIPTDTTVDPVGIVDELMLAHSDLTDIMLRQSIGDFDTPDLPLVMTYVDEEKGELVVVMDSIAALVGLEYEEEEIRVALGHDIQVRILYGTVFDDAAPWENIVDTLGLQ